MKRSFRTFNKSERAREYWSFTIPGLILWLITSFVVGLTLGLLVSALILNL